MRRYQSKKNYTWTPTMGYVAGLMASDGCLYNDGRHLNLTSKDIDQLETVRALLNLRGEVKQKRNGFGGIGFYIQFSDVALYDFLFEAGIKPAKSKTIAAINILDGVYPDFLRGYFDGDGSINGFWDKRWKNSLMYYTEYTSASGEFLNWLRIQNTRLALTGKGRIKPSIGANSLSYAKADSQKLFSFMYYEPNLPLLKRKHIKFIDFLTEDPYPSMKLARVLELVDRPR